MKRIRGAEKTCIGLDNMTVEWKVELVSSPVSGNGLVEKHYMAAHEARSPNLLLLRKASLRVDPRQCFDELYCPSVQGWGGGPMILATSHEAMQDMAAHEARSPNLLLLRKASLRVDPRQCFDELYCPSVRYTCRPSAKKSPTGDAMRWLRRKKEGEASLGR